MSHASEHYRKSIEAHEALNKRLKAEGKPRVYLSSELAINFYPSGEDISLLS